MHSQVHEEDNMKKILPMFILFLFFGATTCFSQNINMKDYHDYVQGFEGTSTAVYLGDINDNEIQERLELFMSIIPETARTVTKLTKNNMWLLKQALNEWDYTKDECYLVLCAESRWANNCILLIVTIEEDNDFDWFGISLNEKEMEEMQKMIDDLK